MNTKTNKKTKKNKTKKVKFEKITNYIINLSEKEKNVLCKSSTLSFSNFESISLNNTDYNNKLLHFIVKEHETYSINLQKHNYYKYVNDSWDSEQTISYNEFDDYNTYQTKIVDVQVSELYNDFIKDKTKEYNLRKNVLNFWNSAKKLNSEISIKGHATYYTNIINEMTNDTTKNNLWKLLAFLSKNLIIANQTIPLICECKPNVFNPTLYSVYISPCIFRNNIAIYENIHTNPTLIESYINKYLDFVEKLYVFFLGPNHGLNPKDTYNVLKKLYMCYNNTYLTEKFKVITNDIALKDYNFNYTEYLTEFGYINNNIPNELIIQNVIYLKNVCELLGNEWSSKEWKSYWYYIIFKSLCIFNNESKKINDDFILKFNLSINTYKTSSNRANNYGLIVFNKLFTEL